MTAPIYNACGRITAILFSGSPGSNSILLLDRVETTTPSPHLEGPQLRVLGSFPPIHPGVWLSVAGVLREHPRYGWQFHAESFHIFPESPAKRRKALSQLGQPSSDFPASPSSDSSADPVHVDSSFLDDPKAGQWSLKELEEEVPFREYPPSEVVREEVVQDWLFSRKLAQIGPKTAEKLWALYQEQALVRILEDPETVAKDTRRSLNQILEAQGDLRKQLLLIQRDHRLRRLPISARVRALLEKVLGTSAWDWVRSNPYRLMQAPFRLPLLTCEEIAQYFQMESSDPSRIRAAGDAVLQKQEMQGHVCMRESEWLEETRQLLQSLPLGFPEWGNLRPVSTRKQSDGDEDQMCTSQSLSEDTATFCEDSESEDIEYADDEIGDTEIDISARLETVFRSYPSFRDAQGTRWRYHRSLYGAENRLLFSLYTRLQNPLPPLLEESDWRELAHSSGFILTEEQEKALSLLASHATVILTGGPGTGKTTILQWICSAYRRRKQTCLLAAPTGRAAKRLQEQTGMEATTLHRLLEVQAEFGQQSISSQALFHFSRNAENPLEGDVLIVDEASMIDLPLSAALFEAIPPTMRVILVGDQDQLPSVGPGCVFGDCIQSGTVPVIRLYQVLRQKENSLIVQNSRSILRGRQPVLQQTLDSDWLEVRSTTEEEILPRLLRVLCEILPEQYQLDPWMDAQILVPIRKGPIGVDAINEAVQHLRQKAVPTESVTWFGRTFYLGDRVMQTQNQYDLPWLEEESGRSGVGLFNGDRGTVQAVDQEAQTLCVRFDDGKIASYAQDTQKSLSLSYAMTVHKSQGCEFPAILLLLPRHAYSLQNRSVFYTAVTRAQKHLFLFTTPNVTGRYLRQETSKRHSLLIERLRACLPSWQTDETKIVAGGEKRVLPFELESPIARETGFCLRTGRV